LFVCIHLFFKIKIKIKTIRMMYDMIYMI
jgi:hypothetical protein